MHHSIMYEYIVHGERTEHSFLWNSRLLRVKNTGEYYPPKSKTMQC